MSRGFTKCLQFFSTQYYRVLKAVIFHNQNIFLLCILTFPPVCCLIGLQRENDNNRATKEVFLMYVKDVMLYTAEDLREFMFLAMQSPEDIGVHTKEGKIADAKSVLGLMALDYNKPVKVVTEDGHFIKQIGKWLVNEPKD